MIIEVECIVFKRFEKTLQNIYTTNENLITSEDFIKKKMGIDQCFIWDVPFTTSHGLNVKKNRCPDI